MRVGLITQLLLVLSALAPLCASAQTAPGGHALIVGISTFKDPAISELPGLENDIAHARKIAAYLGIEPRGVSVLADGRATADAVQSELERIAAQIKPDDKAFIYLSTHGSRWTNPDTGGCDESLIFYDGEHITKDKIAELLKPIAQKAYKLLVFLDTCHSGGFVVTRSIGSRIVPKYQVTRTRDKCEVAINDLADRISPVPPRTRSIAPNSVVVVTAARENEYALHREDIGGLATYAWAQCALGKATDLDRSGGISLAEVEACAQREIEAQLEGERGYKPHHITTRGERGLPLSLLAAAPEPIRPAPTPPVAVAMATETTVMPETVSPSEPLLRPTGDPVRPTTDSTKLAIHSTKPIANPVPQPPPPQGPIATLRDILAISDGRWGLDVQVANPRLEIQKDFLSLRLRSERPGFVYMLAVGSDNKTVDILFPNRLDRRNVVRAGEDLTLPRVTWRLRARGPAGTNRVLVLVAETERNFANSSFEDLAGVFLRARPDQSNDLQRSMGTAGADRCKVLNERGNVVDGPCTPRFAARIVEIQEVARP